MPYTTKPIEDKIGVFRADADGAPQGEPLGTHATEADAQSQITAITINESKDADKAVADSAVDSLATGVRLVIALVRKGDLGWQIVANKVAMDLAKAAEEADSGVRRLHLGKAAIQVRNAAKLRAGGGSAIPRVMEFLNGALSTLGMAADAKAFTTGSSGSLGFGVVPNGDDSDKAASESPFAMHQPVRMIASGLRGYIKGITKSGSGHYVYKVVLAGWKGFEVCTANDIVSPGVRSVKTLAAAHGLLHGIVARNLIEHPVDAREIMKVIRFITSEKIPFLDIPKKLVIGQVVKYLKDVGRLLHSNPNWNHPTMQTQIAPMLKRAYIDLSTLRKPAFASKGAKATKLTFEQRQLVSQATTLRSDLQTLAQEVRSGTDAKAAVSRLQMARRQLHSLRREIGGSNPLQRVLLDAFQALGKAVVKLNGGTDGTMFESGDLILQAANGMGAIIARSTNKSAKVNLPLNAAPPLVKQMLVKLLTQAHRFGIDGMWQELSEAARSPFMAELIGWLKSLNHPAMTPPDQVNGQPTAPFLRNPATLYSGPDGLGRLLKRMGAPQHGNKLQGEMNRMQQQVYFSARDIPGLEQLREACGALAKKSQTQPLSASELETLRRVFYGRTHDKEAPRALYRTLQQASSAIYDVTSMAGQGEFQSPALTEKLKEARSALSTFINGLRKWSQGATQSAKAARSLDERTLIATATIRSRLGMHSGQHKAATQKAGYVLKNADLLPPMYRASARAIEAAINSHRLKADTEQELRDMTAWRMAGLVAKCACSRVKDVPAWLVETV